MVSRRRAAALWVVGASGNTVIITIQAFVLVPLALNRIGSDLYGAWVGSGGVLVWLQLFDLGFTNLLIQRVGAAYGRGEARVAADYFASGTTVIGLLALVVAAIGTGIAGALPGWLEVAPEDAELLVTTFRVAAWGSGLGMLTHAFVGLGRAIQQTGLVALGMVAGSMVGFGVTLVLLLAGRGLWALALGVVARSVVMLLIGLAFAVGRVRKALGSRGRVRLGLVREYLVVSPPSAVGVMGYGAMGQAETALVAIFVGTDAGLVYGLTRRAADAVNALVDMVAYAAYGGFSHLVGSGDRTRAASVLRDLASLRLALAVAGGAGLLALNGSLVALWVGPEYFGGFWLNLLVVLQLAVCGQAFLLNSLYRASGPVLRGSVLLSGEALARYGIGTGLLLLLGSRWMPAAGVVLGAVFGWVYWSLLVRLLGPGTAAEEHRLSPWWSRLLLLGAATAVGLLVEAGSWLSLVLMTGGIGLVLAWAAWSLDWRVPVLVRTTLPEILRGDGSESPAGAGLG